MKHFLTLTRMRIRLTLRNKMFLFFSVIMPFGFFFLFAGIIAKGDPRLVKFLLWPVIAMAVMGSEAVFIGLDRATVWVQPDYRVANSTYTFFYSTLSLP